MPLVRICCFWLFLFCGCFANQENAGLNLDQLLLKLSEANGKSSLWESLNNLSVHYEVEMIGMGMKMQIEMLLAQNKARIVTNMNGMALSEQRFDGTTAWSKDMMMGLRELKGEEKFALEQILLKYMSSPQKLYDKMNLLGKTKFKEHETYEVLCQKKGMEDSWIYIDAQSFLVVGLKATQVSPQGKLQTVSEIKKYTTTPSGLKFASLMEVEAGPMKMQMTATEIKENVPSKAEDFGKPE